MRALGLFRRATVQFVGGAVLLVTVIGLSVGGGAATAATTSTDVAAVSGVIRPLTADTCSGAVCIYVTGSGLNVSDWETTVLLSKTMCSTASFYDNGVIYALGEQTCGSSGNKLLSNLGNAGNFPNGTILCNKWSGFSGDACVTVHS
jgi:hypothetical protein